MTSGKRFWYRSAVALGGSTLQRLTSFDRVLVVSGSAVFRGLLRFAFMPHANATVLASDLKRARQQLAGESSFELVVCEAALTDGTGFDLLEHVAEMPQPRPAVVFVARRPSALERGRALAKGAAGYVAKPTSVRDIITALKHDSGIARPRAPRSRPIGRASVLALNGEPKSLDDADRQLHWTARDISTTGAFLETESPLPVGSRLALALELAGITVHVDAEVIRVQEPTWGTAGGIGVTFCDCDATTRAALHLLVSEGPDRDAGPR